MGDSSKWTICGSRLRAVSRSLTPTGVDITSLPPVDSPPTPTSAARPPDVESPIASIYEYTSAHFAPPPMTTADLSSFTNTELRCRRLITTPSAIFAQMFRLCPTISIVSHKRYGRQWNLPPPLTANLILSFANNFRTIETSPALDGEIIHSGRTSFSWATKYEVKKEAYSGDSGNEVFPGSNVAKTSCCVDWSLPRPVLTYWEQISHSWVEGNQIRTLSATEVMMLPVSTLPK